MAETTTTAGAKARARARRRTRKRAHPAHTPDELGRLKNRIQELEDQLSRTAAEAKDKLSSSGEKVVDAIKDSLRKQQIENVKLLRGITEASVEGLNGSVRAVSDFLEGLSQRDRVHEGATVTELSSHFLEDLAGGIARAVESSTDSRARIIDKFYKAYKKDEPQTEAPKQ
jgi:hypothetical protein